MAEQFSIRQIVTANRTLEPGVYFFQALFVFLYNN